MDHERNPNRAEATRNRLFRHGTGSETGLNGAS